MKKLIFAVLALLAPAMLQAQLKVDSLGKTFLGQIPQEQFKKLTSATATIFNNSTSSTLNLYKAEKSIYVTKDFKIPQNVHVIFDAPQITFEQGFTLSNGASIETREEYIL